MDTNTGTSDLLTVEELSSRLRMSRSAFYRMYAAGTAPKTVRYGRRIFVTEPEPANWLAQRSEAAA
jgi:predicted DNA-binding transcriptional regulator AlpA